MHGWLVIDKPVGIGSTQVVGAVKRALREGGYAKVKVGHGGTLDPLASGVLPIALGEATKLSGRMLDADKAYEFTIGFGEETDTLDGEGAVVATSDARPTLAEVEAVLPRFTGVIEQVPPAYSALKVDGKRAYDLARAGEDVVLASRPVTIHDLSVVPGTSVGLDCPRQSKSGPGDQTTQHWWQAEGLTEGSAAQPPRFARPLHHLPSASDGQVDLPPANQAMSVGHGDLPTPPRSGEDQATFSTRVSKGTYIRSLARDIAHALKTVGHITVLRRTKAGPFDLSQAISLDKLAALAIAQRLGEALLPLTAGLDDIPALTVTLAEANLLRQGQRPSGSAARPGLHLAVLDSRPIALVECSEGFLRVVRGFNL